MWAANPRARGLRGVGLQPPSHLGGRQDAHRWGSPRGLLRPLQPPPAPHPGVSARREGGGRAGSPVSCQWTRLTPACAGGTDAHPGRPAEVAGRIGGGGRGQRGDVRQTGGHGTDGGMQDGQARGRGTDGGTQHRCAERGCKRVRGGAQPWGRPARELRGAWLGGRSSAGGGAFGPPARSTGVATPRGAGAWQVLAQKGVSGVTVTWGLWGSPRLGPQAGLTRNREVGGGRTRRVQTDAHRDSAPRWTRQGGLTLLERRPCATTEPQHGQRNTVQTPWPLNGGTPVCCSAP